MRKTENNKKEDTNKKKDPKVPLLLVGTIALIMVVSGATYQLTYNLTKNKIEAERRAEAINTYENNNKEALEKIRSVKEGLNKADLSSYGINESNIYNINYKVLNDLVEQKKTFVVFMGFDSCPWCKQAMPVFNEANNKYRTNALYLNTKEEKMTEEEYKIYETTFGDYFNATKEGVKGMLVPKVFFIKDGEIVYVHEYTVKGHNASQREMTNEEKEKVFKSYEEGFKMIINTNKYNKFKRLEENKDKVQEVKTDQQ